MQRREGVVTTWISVRVIPHPPVLRLCSQLGRAGGLLWWSQQFPATPESCVWFQSPVFSVTHVPVLRAPFDRLVSSPLVYSDLVVMSVFKFLPLPCNPCLSCLFISVCTAFPRCFCSAPSCGAWANILFFAGKTLFWAVGFFIPCLFPAIITFPCSDHAGFSSSSPAHLARPPLHVYFGALWIHPVPRSKCRFQIVVWKTVCSLENGGFSAFSSSLILPVLNEGQHPRESSPKGVILGYCHSSLRNGEEKCTLPVVQALTEEEGVSRKSSG